MKSLQGHLLIATPDLRDPNFSRSVVLMVQHSEQGALGLILNRPTRAAIEEVWNQVSQSPCLASGPLHFGGPIQGPLMVLHSRAELAETQVFHGLCFSVQPDNLEQLISHPPAASMKFFVGYSGWAAGQLENEMKEGSWRTLTATAELVFGPSDDLWETVHKQVTTASLQSLLKLKHLPPDPSLN